MELHVAEDCHYTPVCYEATCSFHCFLSLKFDTLFLLKIKLNIPVLFIKPSDFLLIFLRVANLLNLNPSNPDKCYLYPRVTKLNLQQKYQAWNQSGKYIK